MTATSSLSAHPCFETLDPESCRVLDRKCAWLTTPAGAWVDDQGDKARDVYFVLTGRLMAAIKGAQQNRVVTDIEAGSFCGELGALDSSGVFAVNDATLAKMPSGVFIHAIFAHRPLGQAVVAPNRAMTRKVAAAADIDGGRPPYVGSTQPLEARFGQAGLCQARAPHRRARRWS